MKHSEGFLKLVDDAKSRVREVSVAEPDEQLFCYVDCDEHTGLLAAASGEQPS